MADKIDSKEQGAAQPVKQAPKKRLSPGLRAAFAGLSLAVIAGACMLLVIGADASTAGLIEHNRNDAKIMRLARSLLPSEALKGAERGCKIISDRRIGKDMKIYTFIRDGHITGHIMTFSSRRGYSQPLVFVAGFTPEHKISRVDVLISNETPGLGDRIDRKHGDYLDAFSGLGLEDAKWDVKKYGGDFDYFTGATVTSRAAVLAMRDALKTLEKTDIQRLKDCGKTRGEIR
ncbi:MAG: RnfABCDGE type electron transport complex subunit G [Succinivibrio sp.]|jgi:electron transport complex protein RnfG|nr:RnfABCDGE type electron transport complex subunit G [Succinivibrio sp.]